MTNQPAAADPLPPTLERQLDELVLKPLLVRLKWAVSHDPQPDKFTENIATFLSEAEQGRAALPVGRAEPTPEVNMLHIVEGSERWYCRVEGCDEFTADNVPFGRCGMHALEHLGGAEQPDKGFPPIGTSPRQTTTGCTTITVLGAEARSASPPAEAIHAGEAVDTVQQRAAEAFSDLFTLLAVPEGNGEFDDDRITLHCDIRAALTRYEPLMREYLTEVERCRASSRASENQWRCPLCGEPAEGWHHSTLRGCYRGAIVEPPKNLAGEERSVPAAGGKETDPR